MEQQYGFTMEPFARAFAAARGRSVGERVALGMLEAARYQTITFPDNCMLPTVECCAPDSAVEYRYGGSILLNEGRCEELAAKYPQHAEALQALWAEMRQYTTPERFVAACAPADRRLGQSMACWGGDWAGHANISFGRLGAVGTAGIRAEIAEYRAQNPGKDDFYTACDIAMQSLEVLGDRIAAMAAANAAADPARAGQWQRIADAFAVVPRQPAPDLASAVMVYWMLFTVDGIDSPGRFDQEMIGWYEKAPAAERLDVLRRFLEAMHNVRGWNLCISGSDENWNDETNILSYDILQLVTEMGYQTPNLTVRVHPGTPQRLWEMAAACLATGIGLPAIYNDEVVCAALEKLGIPAADSHDYCMNGCNQIDIMGKSHMGLEDGEVNFGKVLELALHGGYDMRTGGSELIGLATAHPAACPDFDSFMQLYYAHLDFVAEAAVRMSLAAQRTHAYYGPNPLRSCFLQGCLQKGRDYKNGGPLYGHGQVLAEGVADAVDSLYAIRKLVYEEQRYTMEQLVQALAADFEGYEQLQHDFAGCDKFGNDIAEVDAIAAEVMGHFFAWLKTRQTFRGGVFTGGCSPFSRAAANGMGVAALPNGKKCGAANYADSIAATPGNDVNGPTASIKSMLRYDHTEAGSGFVAQMKFEKSLFASEKGQAAFLSLARTYFAGGGQQLSVNVLDRDTLLAAQKNPQAYRSLVVRVGGYSDYFCNLSPELQQNVIDRASFGL